MTTTTRTPWVLLAAALLQVAAPAVQSLLDVAQPADGSDDLLITPVGWTFSIWGVIYLLAIVHAVVALRVGDGIDDPRFVRDLIALYVGAAIWIAASATGSSLATLIVLAVMTWFAIDAARLANGAGAADPAWTGTLARATSGLYAGWVSAAVFLNVGTAALEIGLGDADQHGWQVVLLVMAAIFALSVNAMLSHTPAYAVAIVWALIGIVAGTTGESTAATVVAAVALVAVVGQTLLSALRSR